MILRLISRRADCSYRLEKPLDVSRQKIDEHLEALEYLKLAERAPDVQSDHGAHFYRLSSLGWFHLFYSGQYTFLQPYYQNLVPDPDYRNEFLEALLHPYFELSTLSSITDRIERAVMTYLEQCCHVSLLLFQDYRKFVDEAKPKGDHGQMYYNWFKKELELELTWQAQALALKLALMKETRLVDQKYEDLLAGKFTQMGEEDRTETLRMLAKDHKFMKTLRGAFERLNENYDELMRMEERP